MAKTKKENDIILTIKRIVGLIEASFEHRGPNMEFDQFATFVKDLITLFDMYADEDSVMAGRLAKAKLLPIIEHLIRIDKKGVRKVEYIKDLEQCYRIMAKGDFESFVIYNEWAENDKFYEPRYEILHPYAYYLNKMVFDPNFELLIVNLPSGTGKTYLEKNYEAFSMGIDDTGTFLSLCSNDDVVKGGSRTVMDMMKSERFGNVFPHLKYEKTDKDYFLKETEGEWKLRNCKLTASYYAKTVNSNVVGCRASKSIHIDDLYADYAEALNENTNEYYYNKYLTVWKKRYVQNKKAKVIVTGTMWSPTDFIVKVINLAKKEKKFIPDPKHKYVMVSEDGTQAIIQIPAMDYVTGESTCKALWSTEQLQKEKDSMDLYLWETNFQQRPISPKGLIFDWNNLQCLDIIPENKSGYCKAVIDGTRKSGGDYFSMPIFQPHGDQDWFLKDCIFTDTATSELHDEIIRKIIEHHITFLVIESNVDGGLKKILDQKLDELGISWCIIVEKYSTMVKATRIEMEKGIILKRLFFPNKFSFARNSDLGRFMDNFTLYNSKGRNSHDDACFEGNTLIATQFGYKPIKDIKVGDKVITPFGLRKVTASGITGYKETISKFGLNATPNHKVYSESSYKFEKISKITSYFDLNILNYDTYIDNIGRTNLCRNMYRFNREGLQLIFNKTDHWFNIGVPHKYVSLFKKIKETINYSIFKLMNKINGMKIKHYVEPIRGEIPVYNITVENAGCYYANGILVSNCDSVAMFAAEIIEEKSKPQKAKAVKRLF